MNEDLFAVHSPDGERQEVSISGPDQFSGLVASGVDVYFRISV